MKNIDKLLEDTFGLPRSPFLQFVHYSSTGQVDKLEGVADDAFRLALSVETDRETLDDISKHSNLGKEDVTKSLCRLAETGSWDYALELGEKYGADLEKLEAVAFDRDLQLLSMDGVSFKVDHIDKLETGYTHLSESKKEEIVRNRYESFVRLCDGFSRDYISTAKSAKKCANMLGDDELIEESDRILFKQLVWCRSYEQADSQTDLKQEDMARIARDVARVKYEIGRYDDAKDILEKYVVEDKK